jgi:hypothetical protein
MPPPFAMTALRALLRPWRPLPIFLPHVRLRLMEANLSSRNYRRLRQVQLRKKYHLVGGRATGSKYIIYSVQNTLFTEFLLSQSFSHIISCKD